MAALALAMAISFALVATRMAAFVVVSPFPGATVPTQVRIGLVLLLAATTCPTAVSGYTTLSPNLFLATAGEMITGVAIGFVFRVGMSAAEVLGASLAHATGLTMASSFDPSLGSTVDPLSRIVTMSATLVSFAIGAHRVVLGAVIASLRAVPIGTLPSANAFAPATFTWIARSIECGLGLALPAMTIALVIHLSLGLVARAAPSLQIFSVGLSLTLGSGLLVALAGMPDMLGGLAAHLGELGAVIDSMLSSHGT